METLKLKRFAQFARRSLMEQVSSKLKLVLAENSPARRENSETIKKLEEIIQKSDKEQIIERVAYIWFNRFCALRFMDVNRFNRVNIVSPADPGQFQPEILSEAKMGHIDDEMVTENIRQQISFLLNGNIPSHDPQGEAYRLLVVAACNYWNKAMPFLFEKIEDYTELLMPDDLLSGNSILTYTREAMTPDACEDVEVIGWLYQFYISEKKDEVFDGLKKNKKITPENIPAATQLFTPHWIVRYLVENSLGRLWLLNRPNSQIFKKMKEQGKDCYYIEPEQPETDFLHISGPEEIKICDPACGSGHMLTYAFDLLYAIYEEEGYEPAEIPEKILTNNLYGIEIDERAGELAAFALTMKARARQRRFFSKGVKPNICVLENVLLSLEDIDEYINTFGTNLFTSEIVETLRQFEEADNFGSLIRPIATNIQDVFSLLILLQARTNAKIGSQEELPDAQKLLLTTPNFKKILKALRQADYLNSKYHVVIANPPYMSSKGMNGQLGAWVKDNYPNSKSDLFAIFIERNLDLAQKHGAVAMITMQSWMFLSSFEALRARLLGQNTLLSMAHLGARAFDSIGGEVVSTTAFVLENANRLNYKGDYLRLVDGNSEAEKDDAIRNAAKNPNCDLLYRTSVSDLNKIPGSPIAYWGTLKEFKLFEDKSVGSQSVVPVGIFTCDNGRFIRYWHEISHVGMTTNCSGVESSIENEVKWVGFNKGGGSRRWFGNKEYLIRFEHGGKEIKELRKKKGQSYSLPGYDYYFKEGVTWSQTATKSFTCRVHDQGTIHDTAGPTLFSDKNYFFLAYLNSKPAVALLKMINPTLHFQAGDVKKLPVNIKTSLVSEASIIAQKLTSEFEIDWNSFETSWDFTGLPLLNPDYRQPALKATYQKLCTHWREMTLEMQRLEQENNRIFIDAYGLQDELKPEVKLNEITLTCNPHNRYSNGKTDEELDALLLADTMRELVSYAVGCMFGRYALDKPGLILANQGETLADFVRKVCSEEWVVDSEGGNNGDSSQLQRVNSLAEGDGFGGVGVSGKQAVSERGALRADQSGQTVGSLNPFKHSGRSGKKIDGGVSEFLVDCERFKSRDGDSNPACPALEVCNERYRATNSQSVRRSEPTSERADEQSQIATHCPLSTIHFLPDDDNVIPMLDGDWFTDDITERFHKFLRVAFGDEHYEENLSFVEEGLGKDIRKYFLKDFYSDHVKRYKKRPIYWLFSSPKGSFNALIYMHRYRPDTVSVVLTDYLRDFIEKLSAHKKHLEAVSINTSASQGEKSKARNEIEKINKTISELEEYERDVLYPLATAQVEIDLDDGVKVNYPKFGAALKKITGLS